MPAPNDLTPEEEAMFAQHGVTPAGQGAEPVIENVDDLQGGQQQDDQQHGDRTVVDDGQQQQQQDDGQQQQTPAPGELGSKHRADGTFKSKEELEADRVALEQQGGDQQQQQEPKMVPLQALHEARQKAAQATQQAQLLMTRMNAILSRQQQQQMGVGQEQMPDLNEDPAGYIRAMEARLAAFEQRNQEDQQYRQIDSAIEQDEAMFSQAVPDYEQASDYYVQSRAKELLAFHTPDKAREILTNEARAIATQAWERGVSCAQMVYQLAQARGFQPGNTAADPTRAPIPARPNGQQQNGQQRPTAAAVIESTRQAQQASRSLSGGAGAQTSTLNAEAILAMDDEEFERHLALGTKGANARFAAIG